MCGILGKLYFKSHPQEKPMLLKCLDTLTYRGPDDAGHYEDRNVFLGSRRLSIIDLTKDGRMPMSNEDDTLWITFNGEIYNYLELRRNLQEKHRFKSHTDTEVILHLYEQYGPACLEKLRGMFAIAIWDTRKRELFLARDQLGKKPLKYYYNGNFFMFASELKALLKDPSVPKEMDTLAIDNFLTYQYVPSPRTGFRDIYKLEPAHYLIVGQNGEMKKERYWESSFRPKINLPQEALEAELLSRLQESVRLRLRSDVRLGAHLSGGLDSSLVVALMAREMKDPVKTFSIGFEKQEYSELPFARLVAKQYGTEHHEIMVKQTDVEILNQLMFHYEEPFADLSIIPTWKLCEESKKEVTVILNGDGGDENFAGYFRYYLYLMSYRLRTLPFKQQAETLTSHLYALSSWPPFRQSAKLISALRDSPNDAVLYAKLIGGFHETEKTRLYTDTFLRAVKNNNPYSYLQRCMEKGSVTPLERLLGTDIETYLGEDLLTKIDIAGMSHSLEVRSPFLDQEFVAFAGKLPDAQKLRGMSGKYILKKIASKFLPAEIINRKKQAFEIPLKSWMENEWSGSAQSLLENTFFSYGIFDRKRVRDLVRDKRSNYRHLWTLLVLKAWLTEWFPS